VKFINGVIAETDEFGGRFVLEDDVMEYQEESGIPFPAYMDSEDTLAGDYNVQTVPVLAFVTKEGRLMLVRPFTYTKDIARIIDALIAGRQIDTSDMETVAG
jgi:hypothetical protein